MMNRKRSGVLAVVAFVVLGFTFGGFMAVREQGGRDFALFRLKRWYVENIGGGYPKATPAGLARAKREAEAATARIIREFPELGVKMDGVPPERNGFLALLGLCDDARVKALVASKLPERSGAAPEDFDAAAISADLELHREIGEEIERVASMPERSSADLPGDYMGFLPAREVKCMAEYLMLKSRLAAERGDADEAFRMMALAVNLRDHCAKVELPTFLSETVVILVGLSTRSVAFQHILPKLGKGEDLGRWRELLAPSASPSARHAKALVGEWHWCGRGLISLMFVRNSKGEIPDPEAAWRAYGAWIAANAKALPAYSAEEFLDKGTLPFPRSAPGLSAEGVGMLGVLAIGNDAWEKGLMRAHVIKFQFDAAMELLIREQAGESLSGLSKTFVQNPVTGLPFTFDPATRTVIGEEVSPADRTDDIILPW